MNQRPAQVLCRQCGGGNDPSWRRCQWCGRNPNEASDRSALIALAIVALGVLAFIFFGNVVVDWWQTVTAR